MAFEYGISERVRARVEELGRAPLSHNEISLLARQKTTHLVCISILFPAMLMGKRFFLNAWFIPLIGSLFEVLLATDNQHSPGIEDSTTVPRGTNRAMRCGSVLLEFATGVVGLILMMAMVFLSLLYSAELSA